jgi:hypothetical protein
MLTISSNTNPFLPYSNETFKLEAKIKITSYDGKKKDAKQLIIMLKKIEAYFNMHRIREENQIYFSCLNMSKHALI